MSEDARSLVIRLLSEARLSPIEISDLLGKRVSPRTVYRWANGESRPQNLSDYEALKALVADLPKRGRKLKSNLPEGTPVDTDDKDLDTKDA